MVWRHGASHPSASTTRRTLDKGVAGATQGGRPTYFECSSFACMVEKAIVPFGKEAVEWMRTRLVIILLIPVVSSVDLLKYNIDIESKLQITPSSNEL